MLHKHLREIGWTAAENSPLHVCEILTHVRRSVHEPRHLLGAEFPQRDYMFFGQALGKLGHCNCEDVNGGGRRENRYWLLALLHRRVLAEKIARTHHGNLKIGRHRGIPRPNGSCKEARLGLLREHATCTSDTLRWLLGPLQNAALAGNNDVEVGRIVALLNNHATAVESFLHKGVANLEQLRLGPIL